MDRSLGLVYDLSCVTFRSAVHMAVCRRVPPHDLVLAQEGIWSSTFGGT